MAPLKYPGAVWKPLGAMTEPRITPEIICVHTIVGTMASTYDGWLDDGYGGLEATFAVGGRWGRDGDLGLDGVVWQVQDVRRHADANLDGSHRIVSIETADNGADLAADIPRWTDRQARSLVRLIAWLCHELDIPPVLVADSKPGRRGLAYHRQGVRPGPGHEHEPGWLVAGGERWSRHRGKECPGPVRIRQFIDEIVPAVQAELEGDDMAFPTSHEDALSWFNLYWRGRLPGEDETIGGADAASPGSHLVRVRADTRAAREKITALETRLAAIEAALATLAANLSTTTPEQLRHAVTEEFAAGTRRLQEELESAAADRSA